jgi:hypothetical protein
MSDHESRPERHPATDEARLQEARDRIQAYDVDAAIAILEQRNPSSNSVTALM